MQDWIYLPLKHYYFYFQDDWWMKEFNESMLYKYSVVFWYAGRQSFLNFFSLSSISKADGKKIPFVFVPISICIRPLTTFLSAVCTNNSSVADTAHFFPPFFSVRYFDLTNFAIRFHSVSVSPCKKLINGLMD